MSIIDFLRRKIVDQTAPSLEAIMSHIERYIGKPESVMHEVRSEYVHVDVHIVRPTERRNFYTLVTSGMSDLPMRVPEGLEEYQFAELMICLPPDWPIAADYQVVEDGGEYEWPVTGIRLLAHLPHQCKTWLGWGHSIPLGDPPQTIAPPSTFCGLVLLDPKTVSGEFCTLDTPSGKHIRFWALYPVYAEEMKLKLDHGAERLEELFQQFHVTELLDPKRRNVAVSIQ